MSDVRESPAWRGDLLAGVTGGILAIPQGIAFALIAGMPPEHGLYAMIVPTVIAALLRRSPYLASGATNTAALVIGALITSVAAPEDDRVAWMIAITLLTGLLQIAVGALRLGDIGRYVSQAVLLGFTFGATTLMFGGQIRNALGLELPPEARFLSEIAAVGSALGSADPRSIAVALVTLAILAACARISKILPAPMIALVVAVAMTLALGWVAPEGGIAVLGEIPRALPVLTVPELSLARIELLLAPSAALALLGVVETITIGKALAAQTRTPFFPNVELVAQGAANVAASFSAGLPTSSSWTRSALNLQMSARTPRVGIVNAATVLVVMLVLAPYARFVPTASLGAIVMWISARMVDLPSARAVWRWSRADGAVMAITWLGTLLVPIQYAIYLGVFASLVLMVSRAARLHMVEMVSAGPRSFRELELDEGTGTHPITLLQLEGDLFFGVVDELEEKLERIAANGTRAIIVRLKRAHAIDATAAESLADFGLRFRGRGGRFVLCGVKPELHRRIAGSRLGDVLGAENLLRAERQTYASIRHAIESVRREISGQDEPDDDEQWIRPLPPGAPAGESYSI